MIPLCEAIIASLIQDSGVHIEIFNSLLSTQDYLLDQPSLKSFHICLAEEQTQGRGRFGRSWYSPKGRNIYCSFSYFFNKDIRDLSGLGLALGTMIATTLQDLYPLHPFLKWPNDIYVHGTKLGGILIEIRPDSSGKCMAIIGYGLNINMVDAPLEKIDQPWTSLEHILNMPIDRNILLGHLFNSFRSGLALFESSGFEAFKDKWDQHDFLKNKAVSLQEGPVVVTGTARGVNSKGYLRLELPSQEIQEFSAGNTSLLKPTALNYLSETA